MTRNLAKLSGAVRKAIAIGLCGTCSMSLAWAQQPADIEPIRPTVSIAIRPYLAPEVPPIRLTNSGRLHDLVRAGILYLSVQDVLALVLENNIDIEVARYNPLASVWQVERAQAGGALPGVPSGAAQAGSVASGQGIAGSQAAAGVSLSGSNGAASGTSNATISQVGPITQTLDPSIQEANTFSHKTTPEFDVVQSITPVLISNTRVYSGSYQQGFLIGGSVTASYTEHYLNENAPTDVLNPSVAPSLSFSFQQNLLRGFGVAVNARTITVAKMNQGISDLNFRTQVIGTVAQTLNLYYGLVADYEDLKAKQSALELAQILYRDNRRQLEIGSLTPLDVTIAEAQLASAGKDLVDSQIGFEQQELQLKNLISRTGLADPTLASARIVPIDRIVIGERDDPAPLPDLIEKALANRSDLAAERASEKASEISTLGTKNGILPTSEVFGGESVAALAGVPHTVNVDGLVEKADPYFVGGMGNALAQLFRRNFPTQRIGGFISAPLENRQAQADYGIDQLQLRQTQLGYQKDLNQLGVDIANAVVALRQSRVRYDAAVKNRVLNEQLLAAEQKKLSLGASVPYNVIQQQRDLSTAQSSEIAALVSYSNARIALDQTLGTILDTYHITLDQARTGHVERPSSLPAELPSRP
jgi:outer membrane protein